MSAEEVVKVYRKLGEACNDAANAIENDDEKGLETALGRFVILCMQLDALK